MSENAIRGVMLSGKSFTAMVGTEVGGTYTSIFLSIDGQEEPDGLEFDYDECLRLYAKLGDALDEIRQRLG